MIRANRIFECSWPTRHQVPQNDVPTSVPTKQHPTRSSLELKHWCLVAVQAAGHPSLGASHVPYLPHRQEASCSTACSLKSLARKATLP